MSPLICFLWSFGTLETNFPHMQGEPTLEKSFAPVFHSKQWLHRMSQNLHTQPILRPPSVLNFSFHNQPEPP
jgi:hypothetical protein